MGGWLSSAEASGVTVGGMEARPTVAVAMPPLDSLVARRPAVVAPSIVVATAPAPTPRDTRGAAAPPSLHVEWRVVVGLALAGRAHALRARQEQVCCAGCGRAGRVAAVEVKRHLWVDEAPWPRRTGGG